MLEHLVGADLLIGFSIVGFDNANFRIPCGVGWVSPCPKREWAFEALSVHGTRTAERLEGLGTVVLPSVVDESLEALTCTLACHTKLCTDSAP